MKTRPRALLVLLVPLALLLPGVPASAVLPTAGEPPPTTWGIAPSGPDGPGERTAFEYAAEPGEVLRDVVSVSNYTEDELRLDVYAADALIASGGVFDLLPRAESSEDVGAWVDLGDPVVTIPPRSRIDIPFTVVVPGNATPGDHAGGIVASVATADSRRTGVSVEHRVGARIYLRVAGTLNPRLTLSTAGASFEGSPLGTPGTVELRYTVTNDGNVRLAGRPSARVAGPLGIGARSWEGELLPELLPGDSVTLNADVTGMWPLGRLDVDLWITPETSGSQVLDPAPPAAHATITVWGWPAVPLVVIGLIVLGAVALVVRRRLRRAGRAPAGVAEPTPVDSDG